MSDYRLGSIELFPTREEAIRQRDIARAELEAATQQVKILQEQLGSESRPRLRITVELEIHASGPGGRRWHTHIQAQTDLAGPMNVVDSAYFPDIHNAVHYAWSVLNRLQYEFNGPHAKENA